MTRKWIWEEINDQKLFDPVIKLVKTKSENSKKDRARDSQRKLRQKLRPVDSRAQSPMTTRRETCARSTSPIQRKRWHQCKSTSQLAYRPIEISQPLELSPSLLLCHFISFPRKRQHSAPRVGPSKTQKSCRRPTHRMLVGNGLLFWKTCYCRLEPFCFHPFSLKICTCTKRTD